MKKWIAAVLAALIMLMPIGAEASPDALTQIIVVTYTGGSSCTVTMHEKTDGRWVMLGSTTGYLGRNGVGKTEEGDGKTPLGVYRLTTAFGILPDPGTQLPYTQVTDYHYWCVDPTSEYYNTFCDSRVNGRACTSADEHLIDCKGYYNYCLFIDYNASGIPSRGSGIFLHCAGSRTYTSGCIAVPEAFMKDVICRVKSGAEIIILR